MRALMLAGVPAVELLPTTTLSQAFALAVVVTALFLGAREGRVRSLKSQVDDLQDVVEIRRLRAEEESRAQAARIAQLATELAAERETTAQARRDLTALSRVVTGEAHYVVLGELVEEKTSAVLARLDDLVERLERITP
jgi:cell division protein FtsL